MFILLLINNSEIMFVDYLKHILVQPPEVQLRYDQPEVRNCDSLKDRAIHITQFALPLLSLYRPLGKPIALISGVHRTVSHFSFAIFAFKEGKFKEGSKQLFQTAISAFIVASTVFEFKIGLFLINIHDVLNGIYNVVVCLQKGELDKAAKEMLQVLVSLLYLSFMTTGTLEYLLAMYVIQAIVALWQCRDEFSANRLPEAGLAFILALARVNQAKDCYHQIQTRDLLLSIAKCQKLFERALKGRVVREMITHELGDIDGSIEKRRVVFTSPEGKEYDFGSHFNEFGKELVKGGNLELRKITVAGQTMYEIDFKMNAVFRNQVEHIIADYKSMDANKVSAILEAAHSTAKGISIDREDYPMGTMQLGDAYRISVEGLGNVIVGSTDEFPGLKHRVIVQMDSSKNLFHLHELLSLVGMERAIQPSSAEDINRLKMGHLFRIFYPREATPFERTEEFFTLPIDQLRSKIVEKQPEMENVLNTYMDRMEKAEILPGKVRYKVDGLADELRAKGATTLTAALTGAYTEEDVISRVETILKMGMTSNETRASHGAPTPGISVEDDFEDGSADSVFTQMLTQGHNSYEFNYLAYWSKVRVMIGLEALELGTYQYHYDSFGTRKDPFDYPNRPGITEFVEEQNRFPTLSNEVMLKERVDPKYIVGLVAESESLKLDLMNHLRNTHLTSLENGVECVNGIPLDQFIKTESNIGDWSRAQQSVA